MKLVSDVLSKIIHGIDKLSYRIKLMISFILAITIPIIIICVITYFISTSQMENQVAYSFSQTLQQVEINLDKRTKQIKEVSDLINQDYNIRSILTSTEEKEFYDELQDFRYLDRYLRALEDNFHIYKIRLYIAKKTMYSDEGHSFFSISELDTIQGMDRILDGKDSIFWKPTYSQAFKHKKNQYVFSAVSIMKDYFSFKTIGVCFVDVLEDELYSSIDDITGKDGTITSIIDSKGIVISSKDKNLLGKKLDLPYLDRIIIKKENSFKVDNHLIMNKTIASSDMILVSDIPLDIIKNKTFIITKIILIVMFFALVFAVFLSMLLSKSLSKKLNFLLFAMKKNRSQENEEFLHNVQLPPMLSYDDEIGQLIVTYNKMVNKIKRLIDEVYHVKLQESEARFKILQAQINPHFLYNILESIKSFISIQKLDMANELIVSLGKFYRITLSNGKDRITIGEELEMTRLYVDMQKICYGDELVMEIDVHEDILPFLITKFTLQPIVENAVKHAFKNRHRKGKIKIIGFFEGDDILINVIDDGAGMDKDLLAKLESGLEDGTKNLGQGYGLYNVNARLRINHTNRYGVRVSSKLGEGTLVQVVIPQDV